MSRQEYDNTNRGALFPNDKKESDKHPDYTGSINIEGKEYWISGWEKLKDDDTVKVISLSVKVKESRQDRGGSQPSRQPRTGRTSGRPARDEFSDDGIPDF